MYMYMSQRLSSLCLSATDANQPAAFAVHRWGKGALVCASPWLTSLLLLWLLAIYTTTSLQHYYGFVPEVKDVWHMAAHWHVMKIYFCIISSAQPP